MRNFFSGTKYKITLCVFTALLLGVFFSAVSNSGVSPLSSALNTVMSPLENLAFKIVSIMGNFSGHFVSAKKYEEEIESLRQEISGYKNDLVDYERILHKLDAYEKFLDVKDENPDYSFISASIIRKDASDIYGSFTLNKGSSDRVSANAPVIYGNALVGLVKSVFRNSCVVNTLFNPAINVSSYEIRTREECYTSAENSLSLRGFIKLEGLSKTTPVVPGGIVCSSGIGGIYPKDLFIGRIKEIINDDMGISVYALIEPEADYSQLSDVFIITDFNGKGS